MRKVRERYKQEQGQGWGRQRQRDTQEGEGQENSETGRDRSRNIIKERENHKFRQRKRRGRGGGSHQAGKERTDKIVQQIFEAGKSQEPWKRWIESQRGRDGVGETGCKQNRVSAPMAVLLTPNPTHTQPRPHFGFQGRES